MTEILGQQPIFRGFRPEHLAMLAGCAELVHFKAGEPVAHAGDEAGLFFVIRHGSVALQITAPGRGPLMIQSLGDGEPVGWSWLFEPYRWHFDAVAREVTRAVSLHGDCLRLKCDEDHEFGYLMMSRFAQYAVENLEATRLQLLDVYGQAAVC